MIPSHRTAFPLTKSSDKPIKSKIDKIINEAQLKMKDLISRKQEIETKTDLLLGQEKKLSESIKSVNEMIILKKGIVETFQNEYSNKEKKIISLEEKKKKETQSFNEKEADFKEIINKINQDLNSIENGTLEEEGQKKAEIKKTCEELLALKAENDLLKEQLFIRNRELRQLEAENENTLSDDEKNLNKVQKGIENISTLYEIEQSKHCRKEKKENENDEEEYEQSPPKMTQTNDTKGNQNAIESTNEDNTNKEKLILEKIKNDEDEHNKIMEKDSKEI